MAELRSRVSGYMIMLPGCLLLTAACTLPRPWADKAGIVTLAALIPLVGLTVLRVGSRMNDLCFALVQCAVEIAFVPITFALDKPGSSQTPADTGFFVPILISAVFAERRRNVALQVAVTIGCALVGTQHRLGNSQLPMTVPGEALAYIASTVVVRLLREVAEQGLRQSEASLKLAEAATRRAEVREITDSLTGLLNRRGFERTGIGEWNRRAQQRLPLAVLLIDVDHFKRVNDTFGHAAGDELLRNIAERLTSLLREGDGAYRLGGEEFAILARCQLGEASVIAERVRRVIQDELSITVSIGVVEAVPSAVTDTVATLWRVIDRTDQALYAAKRAGRNRVMTSEAGGGLIVGG